VAASGGSSPSIRELWPDIDKLDEMRHECTSIVHTHDVWVRGRRSTMSTKKAGRRSRREGKKAWLNDASGASNVESISHGGSSAKKEAARILSTAPEEFSL
jgi:hypothetical protein